MTEFEIVYFLNHLGRGTLVDTTTYFVSLMSIMVLLWLVIGIAVLFFDKKCGKWIMAGSLILVGLYFLINDVILKDFFLDSFFFRQRPYLEYPDLIISSGEPWQDSSFPSGHMAITLALIGFFLYFYRQFWFWLTGILIVLFMAFARIHNGMHYPSDVFGGAVLGIGYGLLGVYLLNKIKIARLAK